MSTMRERVGAIQEADRLAENHLRKLEAVAGAARALRALAISCIDPLAGLIYKVEPGDLAGLGDALDALDMES